MIVSMLPYFRKLTICCHISMATAGCKLSLVLLTMVYLPVLSGTKANAQVVTNIRLEHSHDKVWVWYDLESLTPQNISAVFIRDEQSRILPKAIKGDLDDVAAGTDKRIEWDALKDVGPFQGKLQVELSLGRYRISVNGKKIEVLHEDAGRMDLEMAVASCRRMGDGWRLPTKEELMAMYTQLHAQGRGGFQNAWYWSSTFLNTQGAWLVGFEQGDDAHFGQIDDEFILRPVRDE